MIFRKKDELDKRVNEGFVRVRPHPDLPLYIYKYTERAEADGEWDDVTRKSRGLVLDNNGEIIISSVPKFFNHDMPFENKQVTWENSYITMKNDGYMIQMKNDPTYGLIITSSGSFDSKYVSYIKDYYGTALNGLRMGYTYICELLHTFDGDESIIVTKHEGTRLVLWELLDENNISSLENIYNGTLDLPDWIEPTKRFTKDEAVKYLNDHVEGVVLTDPNATDDCEMDGDNIPGRVKMKTEWFLNTHRLISNITRMRAWEILSNGEKVEDQDIPDEFLPKMIEWQKELLHRFAVKSRRADLFVTMSENLDDKAVALNTSSVWDLYPENYKSLVFSIRKGKADRAFNMIWTWIKREIKEENR